MRNKVTMQISESGLDLIRHYEGCKLVAYRCPANVLTIGYGHTGPDVKEGMKIDIFDANRLLRQDVAKFEAAVNEMVNVQLTHGQFDALVSFAFNLGAKALKSSTLLKKLNAGDYDGALGEFIRWNKATGRVLAGLTARRESEQEQFIS